MADHAFSVACTDGARGAPCAACEAVMREAGLRAGQPVDDPADWVAQMGVVTRRRETDPTANGLTPPSIMTQPPDRDLAGTPRDADAGADRPRDPDPEVEAYTSEMGYFTRSD